MLPDDVPLVTGPAEERLSDRQLVDYRNHREDFLTWLYAFGKDPESAVGYSADTVLRTAYRVDQFYRWVWDQRGYTSSPSSEDADAYVRDLAMGEESNTHKSNTLSALKRLFKWREYERGGDSWEPEFTFSRNSPASQPRDYLTREERNQLREAALEYGSIPAYNDLSPDARTRWKRYLAQRFEKPMEEVVPADWSRANGWKIPSLVWVSLDCGLRPIEVERATTSWVDTENGVLRIPKEESSKNRDNWTVGLTDRTSDSLRRWLSERQNYSEYHGREALWLTREGNPYRSQSLRYVLQRICEEGDIATSDRSLSWYSLRHSVGTYMTREEGLAAAQVQLRHKSETTTMKYDQAPVEDRKDALERMG
ncbi:site-specific recombinase xerd [Salinarchaeum sp. Harcht-Bsk1]|uniref:tyrosine-type recombinase/integrase n=1 Tax=Salinarchaeum sp. Harcht-Bsk1 TaxID=1333523 RepID=UPI0003422FAF|nr:site-specific integrase [Salinarchaeum sp. Harcht-Bsk1]AGN02566.1 site-specific recombinase xerd [Salinarchaeum sp. Harcht-Bsk1]